MRYFLILWAMPLALFWGWYALAVNDLHFGLSPLSREAHDLVFGLYGNVLGIEPATTALVAKACVIDTLILLGIVAFRRRRAIGERIGRYLWDSARRA